MAADLDVAGIARSGSSGSYSYNVIGSSANLAITFVGWGDAARFSNWLSNGQPGLVNPVPEDSHSTEDGSYMLNGATTDAALNAVVRNTQATWVIPTENEWYKAAYYNPASSTYFRYATSSDTTPTSAPPGSTPNTANFYDGATGYAVTHSTSYSSSQNYLTDVGAYTNSASPYGTFDQSGDVNQWNETLISGSYRGLLGGSWVDVSFYLPSSSRILYYLPSNYNLGVGFRVASIPEPSTAVLGIVGSMLVLLWGVRRK